MSKLLIYNGFIVNEGKIKQASVIIENEKISDILDVVELENFTDFEIFDASGKYVLPGIIDTHVHFREPGLTYKADIFHESRAAAAGGVTTFFDMPNTIPQVTFDDALNQKIKIAEQNSLINFSFYLGATNDNIDFLLDCDKTKVPAIKLFYASSTGNMLVDKTEIIEQLFENIKIPIVVHSEKNSIIEANLEKFKKEFGENIPIEKHAEIRSAESCIVATKELSFLAQKYNTQLHFLHVSTAEEIEFLGLIKKNSENITAEVSPNHLYFDSSDYKKLGNLIKCNPSIKLLEHKNALFLALQNDVIDSIATDHAPHTFDEKQSSYLKAPSGIPSIQHSLNILLEFVVDNKISIEKIVKKMCHNPARIFNISKRGFIIKGYFADLTIVDMQGKTDVSRNRLKYKCQWSPLEGKTFNSEVIATIVNGHFVYKKGKILENNFAMQVEFDR